MAAPEPEYRISVYYSDVCPHLDRALAEIDRALAEFGAPPERTWVRAVFVEDDAKARELGVVGVPTVRVNGRDVELAESRPHLGCRDYVDHRHAIVHYPPAHLIEHALRDAPQPD